jgi:hypothetical protein
MKITKQRLKEIIKEELSEARPAEERDPDGVNTFEMSADELFIYGQTALNKLHLGLLEFQSAVARLVEQHDAGEFVNLKTHANMAQKKIDDIEESWTIRVGRYEGR